jgi:hypothetical protein
VLRNHRRSVVASDQSFRDGGITLHLRILPLKCVGVTIARAANSHDLATANRRMGIAKTC